MMIVKVNCYFCREPLQVTTQDTASVESCPRCGVKFIYDSPSSGRKVRNEIVAAVRETVIHPANEWVAKLLTIEPLPKITDADIEVIGLEIDSHRILFGWYPGELLTALEIAEICGKSKQVIQSDFRAGRFPNASKKPRRIPMKENKMPLRVAPRKDVQAYMIEKKVYKR